MSDQAVIAPLRLRADQLRAVDALFAELAPAPTEILEETIEDLEGALSEVETERDLLLEELARMRGKS